MQDFVRQTHKKLFVVLSYSRRGVQAALEGTPNWDQALVDFLDTRAYPYLDLRTCHLASFERFKGSPAAYLDQYYNGHYAPAGNFFFAQHLKDALVEWLDPTPLPYR